MDSKEALFAPSGTPTVGNCPISEGAMLARRNAPADDLNSVTSLGNPLPVVLNVDPLPVVHEAPIDHECDLDWAVGHDVLLHVHRPMDRIGGNCFRPHKALRIDTLVCTGR